MIGIFTEMLVVFAYYCYNCYTRIFTILEEVQPGTRYLEVPFASNRWFGMGKIGMRKKQSGLARLAYIHCASSSSGILKTPSLLLTSSPITGTRKSARKNSPRVHPKSPPPLPPPSSAPTVRLCCTWAGIQMRWKDQLPEVTAAREVTGSVASGFPSIRVGDCGCAVWQM